MPNPKRQVSFQDNQEEVLEIPCRGDYTVDELYSLYFSAAELEEFRDRDNRLLFELSVRGSIILSSDEDDEDLTGLDTVQTNSMRKHHALIGKQTVFMEQELEEIEGAIRDDDYIAKLYEHVTRNNKVMARNRGFDSALEVVEEESRFFFDDQQLSSLQSTKFRSSIVGDHCPCRNGNITCTEESSIIDSPPPPPASSTTLSAAHACWSNMIVIPIDCE